MKRSTFWLITYLFIIGAVILLSSACHKAEIRVVVIDKRIRTVNGNSYNEIVYRELASSQIDTYSPEDQEYYEMNIGDTLTLSVYQ